MKRTVEHTTAPSTAAAILIPVKILPTNQGSLPPNFNVRYIDDHRPLKKIRSNDRDVGEQQPLDLSVSGPYWRKAVNRKRSFDNNDDTNNESKKAAKDLETSRMKRANPHTLIMAMVRHRTYQRDFNPKVDNARHFLYLIRNVLTATLPDPDGEISYGPTTLMYDYVDMFQPYFLSSQVRQPEDDPSRSNGILDRCGKCTVRRLLDEQGLLLDRTPSSTFVDYGPLTNDKRRMVVLYPFLHKYLHTFITTNFLPNYMFRSLLNQPQPDWIRKHDESLTIEQIVEERTRQLPVGHVMAYAEVALPALKELFSRPDLYHVLPYSCVCSMYETESLTGLYSRNWNNLQASLRRLLLWYFDDKLTEGLCKATAAATTTAAAATTTAATTAVAVASTEREDGDADEEMPDALKKMYRTPMTSVASDMVTCTDREILDLRNLHRHLIVVFNGYQAITEFRSRWSKRTTPPPVSQETEKTGAGAGPFAGTVQVRLLDTQTQFNSAIKILTTPCEKLYSPDDSRYTPGPRKSYVPCRTDNENDDVGNDVESEYDDDTSFVAQRTRMYSTKRDLRLSLPKQTTPLPATTPMPSPTLSQTLSPTPSSTPPPTPLQTTTSTSQPTPSQTTTSTSLPTSSPTPSTPSQLPRLLLLNEAHRWSPKVWESCNFYFACHHHPHRHICCDRCCHREK